ncbi:hypothetical protein SNEBB_003065 [Seison nebaliae]|nr:hypothetical protein SNEBB_003065 [Seison nebaliae]
METKKDDYRIEHGVQIDPNVISLTQCQKGKNYMVRITLLNLDQKPKKISVIKSNDPNWLLSAKQPIVFEITPKSEESLFYEYKFSSKHNPHNTSPYRPLSEGVLEVLINKSTAKIPYSIYGECAEIIFDEMNFTFDLLLNDPNVFLQTNLKNVGRYKANIEFRPKDPHIFVNMKKSVATPGESLPFEIGVDVTNEISITTGINVFVNDMLYPKPILVTAEVKICSLDLISKNTQQKIERIDFSSVYYGCDYFREALIFNKSKFPIQFLIFAGTTNDGQQDNTEDEDGDFKGANKNDRVFGAFPTQGELRPFEKRNVVFRFSPRMKEPAIGFKSTEIVPFEKEHSMIIYIVDVVRWTQSTSMSDPDSAAAKFCCVTLTGNVHPVNLSFEPDNAIEFGEVLVGQGKKKECEVLNLSRSMTLNIKFQKLANFHVCPEMAQIKPLSKQPFIVIFTPKQIGTFNYSIGMDVLGPIVKSDYFNAQRGPFYTRHIEVNAESMQKVDYEKLDEKFNKIVEATKYKYPKKEAKELYDPIPKNVKSSEKLYKIRKELELEDYETNAMVSERYALNKEERQKVKQHRKLYDIEKMSRHVEKPRDVITDPSKIEDTLTQSSSLLKKKSLFPKEWQLVSARNMIAERNDLEQLTTVTSCPMYPRTQLQKQNTSVKLNPIESLQTVFYPETLNFGIVQVKSSCRLNLYACNQLDIHIYAQMETDIEELKLSFPRKQVIPPKSKAIFPICFQSETKQHFQRDIKFTINKSSTRTIRVTAEVASGTLNLYPKHHLILGTTCASSCLPNIISQFHGMVTLTNPQGIPMTFRWERVSSDVGEQYFQDFHESDYQRQKNYHTKQDRGHEIVEEDNTQIGIDPPEGVVAGNASIMCEVIWKLDYNHVTDKYFMVLFANGSHKIMKVSLSFTLANITFVDRSIDFGIIPTHLPSERTFYLANKSDCYAIYDIGMDPNAKGINVSPKVGMIAPESFRPITVSVQMQKENKFEVLLTVKSRTEAGGTKLRVSGSASNRLCEIDQPKLLFGSIFARTRSTIPFRLYNDTSCMNTVEISFSRQSDFWITFSSDVLMQQRYLGNFDIRLLGDTACDMNDNLLIKDEYPTAENRRCFLIVPKQTSIELVLNIYPVEVATYDFPLPMLVNTLQKLSLSDLDVQNSIPSPTHRTAEDMSVKTFSKSTSDLDPVAEKSSFSSQMKPPKKVAVIKRIGTVEISNDSPIRQPKYTDECGYSWEPLTFEEIRLLAKQRPTPLRKQNNVHTSSTEGDENRLRLNNSNEDPKKGMDSADTNIPWSNDDPAGKTISATVVRPILDISEESFTFHTSRLIQNLVESSTFLNCRSFSLTNRSKNEVHWMIDMSYDPVHPNILYDGVFSIIHGNMVGFPSDRTIKGPSGYLYEGETIPLKIIFSPKLPGTYQAKLPVIVNKTSVYSHLILYGEMQTLRLSSTPSDLKFETVPLNTKISQTIKIEAYGYTGNTKLFVKVPSINSSDESDDETIQPLSCKFVNGNVISVDSDTPNFNIPVSLELEIEFVSDRPISFVAPLYIYDENKVSYELPVSGSADNSMFSSCRYLMNHNFHYMIHTLPLTAEEGDSNGCGTKYYLEPMLMSSDQIIKKVNEYFDCMGVTKTIEKNTMDSRVNKDRLRHFGSEKLQQKIHHNYTEVIRHSQLNRASHTTIGKVDDAVTLYKRRFSKVLKILQVSPSSIHLSTTNCILSSMLTNDDFGRKNYEQYCRLLNGLQSWLRHFGWSKFAYSLHIPTSFQKNITGFGVAYKNKKLHREQPPPSSFTIFEMIENLSGIRIPNTSSMPSQYDDKLTRAKYHYYQRKLLIDFLNANGGLVSHINREILLDYHDYVTLMHYWKKKQSYPKLYSVETEATFTPVEIRKVGYQSYNRLMNDRTILNSKQHTLLCLDAWMTILLQLIKILVISRIDELSFKTAIQSLDEMPMSIYRSEIPTKKDIESSMVHVESKLKKLPPQNCRICLNPVSSNFYSTSERYLLKWINYVYNRYFEAFFFLINHNMIAQPGGTKDNEMLCLKHGEQFEKNISTNTLNIKQVRRRISTESSPENRQNVFKKYISDKSEKLLPNFIPDTINNFAEDFKDGIVIGIILSAYFPIIIDPLMQMYPNPVSREERKSNCNRIIDALKFLGLNFDISPDDIEHSDPIMMCLFFSYLFHHLPKMVQPKSLEFSCALGEFAIQTIQLSNLANKPLQYNVAIVLLNERKSRKNAYSEILDEVTGQQKKGQDRSRTSMKADLESNVFTVSSTNITIQPNSNASLTVTYKGHIVSSEKALLLLYCKKQYPHQSSNMIYLITSRTQHVAPNRYIKVQTPLYEPYTIPIEVRYTARQGGIYNLNLLERIGDDPLQHFEPIKEVSREGRRALQKIMKRKRNILNKIAQMDLPEATRDTPVKYRTFFTKSDSVFIPKLEPEKGRKKQKKQVEIKKQKRHKNILSVVVNITYLPLTIEKRHCTIVFRNEYLGEFTYELEGMPLLPLPQPFSLKYLVASPAPTDHSAKDDNSSMRYEYNRTSESEIGRQNSDNRLTVHTAGNTNENSSTRKADDKVTTEVKFLDHNDDDNSSLSHIESNNKISRTSRSNTKSLRRSLTHPTPSADPGNTASNLAVTSPIHTNSYTYYNINVSPTYDALSEMNLNLNANPKPSAHRISDNVMSSQHVEVKKLKINPEKPMIKNYSPLSEESVMISNVRQTVTIPGIDFPPEQVEKILKNFNQETINKLGIGKNKYAGQVPTHIISKSHQQKLAPIKCIELREKVETSNIQSVFDKYLEQDDDVGQKLIRLTSDSLNKKPEKKTFVNQEIPTVKGPPDVRHFQILCSTQQKLKAFIPIYIYNQAKHDALNHMVLMNEAEFSTTSKNIIFEKIMIDGCSKKNPAFEQSLKVFQPVPYQVFCTVPDIIKVPETVKLTDYEIVKDEMFFFLPVEIQPINFTTNKSEKQIYAGICLVSPYDFRAYSLELSFNEQEDDEIYTYYVEMTSIINKPICQFIPIRNNEEHKLILKCSLEGECFSGETTQFIVPPLKILQYPLTFTPTAHREYKGTLTFKNINRNFKQIFHLIGLGEQIPPFDIITIDAQARSIGIGNVLLKNTTHQPIYYKVHSTLKYLSGPSTCCVAPKKSKSYNFNYFPLVSGNDRGKLIFTVTDGKSKKENFTDKLPIATMANNQGEYIWCDIIFNIDMPQPEQTIDINTVVGTVTTIELKITNPIKTPVVLEAHFKSPPKFKEAVLAKNSKKDVTYSRAIFFIGAPKLKIAACAKATYEFTFNAYVAGVDYGKLIFSHPDIGEFWFSLVCRVTNPEVKQFEDFVPVNVGCPVLKQITLYNPTESHTPYHISLTNGRDFQIVPHINVLKSLIVKSGNLLPEKLSIYTEKLRKSSAQEFKETPSTIVKIANPTESHVLLAPWSTYQLSIYFLPSFHKEALIPGKLTITNAKVGKFEYELNGVLTENYFEKLKAKETIEVALKAPVEETVEGGLVYQNPTDTDLAIEVRTSSIKNQSDETTFSVDTVKDNVRKFDKKIIPILFTPMNTQQYRIRVEIVAKSIDGVSYRSKFTKPFRTSQSSRRSSFGLSKKGSVSYLQSNLTTKNPYLAGDMNFNNNTTNKKVVELPIFDNVNKEIKKGEKLLENIPEDNYAVTLSENTMLIPKQMTETLDSIKPINDQINDIEVIKKQTPSKPEKVVEISNKVEEIRDEDDESIDFGCIFNITGEGIPEKYNCKIMDEKFSLINQHINSKRPDLVPSKNNDCFQVDGEVREEQLHNVQVILENAPTSNINLTVTSSQNQSNSTGDDEYKITNNYVLDENQNLVGEYVYSLGMDPNQERNSTIPLSTLRDVVDVELVEAINNGDGEISLRFQFNFSPIKPLYANAHLLIKSINTGKWKMPLKFWANDNRFEDTIFVECTSDKRIVEFFLSSLNREKLRFQWKFVPVAPPTVKLTTSSTYLLPGEKGTKFSIEYKPQPDDEHFQLKLRIQAENDEEWSYLVLFSQNVPLTSQLHYNNEQQMNQGMIRLKKVKRNFVKENKYLIRTAPSSTMKGLSMNSKIILK